jgi:hypothetical protein
MNKRKRRNNFLKNIRRGIEYEGKEKADWKGIEGGVATFEQSTELNGKKGRIDIFVEVFYVIPSWPVSECK